MARPEKRRRITYAVSSRTTCCSLRSWSTSPSSPSRASSPSAAPGAPPRPSSAATSSCPTRGGLRPCSPCPARSTPTTATPRTGRSASTAAFFQDKQRRGRAHARAGVARGHLLPQYRSSQWWWRDTRHEGM
ncbi:hypothetical protein ACP70R_033404 [Stipagrostis hirtigluma subsp. patula]